MQLEDNKASGTVAVADGAVAVSCAGCSSVGVQVGGTAPTGTVTWEATVNGTDWVAVKATLASAGTKASTTVFTGTGGALLVAPVAGYRQFRGRVSTFTSGTFIFTMRASAAAMPDNASFT